MGIETLPLRRKYGILVPDGLPTAGPQILRYITQCFPATVFRGSARDGLFLRIQPMAASNPGVRRFEIAANIDQFNQFFRPRLAVYFQSFIGHDLGCKWSDVEVSFAMLSFHDVGDGSAFTKSAPASSPTTETQFVLRPRPHKMLVPSTGAKSKPRSKPPNSGFHAKLLPPVANVSPEQLRAAEKALSGLIRRMVSEVVLTGGGAELIVQVHQISPDTFVVRSNQVDFARNFRECREEVRDCLLPAIGYTREGQKESITVGIQNL